MDENLVIDSLQTSRFLLWCGKNVWLFPMPLWCNKHLPGRNVIAFEFFGMFVSTRTPSVVFGVGVKSCACFRNNIPFFRPSSYFLWSNDFDNQQHLLLNSL